MRQDRRRRAGGRRLLRRRVLGDERAVARRRPTARRWPRCRRSSRSSRTSTDRDAGRHRARPPSATRMEQAAPQEPHRQARQPVSQLLSECRDRLDRRRAARSRSPAGPTRSRSSTPLNGTLRATGQLANQAGNLTGAIGSLLGQNLGQRCSEPDARQTLDQRADIRGNVTVTSRPALTAGVADRAQSRRAGVASPTPA